MFRFAHLVSLVACASLAASHIVIVYPGWRGNNIHTNGTVSETDASIKPGSLGINAEANGTLGFPYGMQWMYPCTLAPQVPNILTSSSPMAKREKRILKSNTNTTKAAACPPPPTGPSGPSQAAL